MKPFKIIDLHLSYQLFKKYQNIMKNRFAAFMTKNSISTETHIGFRGKGELQEQYMNFRKVSNSIS